MASTTMSSSVSNEPVNKSETETTIPQALPPSASSSYVFLRIKRKRHEDPVECLVVQSEPQLKRLHLPIKDKEDTPKEEEEKPTRKSVSQNELLRAFTSLSTKDTSFVFKRIDTMESHQLEGKNRSKWTERMKRKVKALKDERVQMKKQTVKAANTMTTTATESRVHQQQDRAKERRRAESLISRGLEPKPSTVQMTQQTTQEFGGVHLVDLATVSQPLVEKTGQPDTTAAIMDERVTVNGARLKPTRVLNPSERELDETIWLAFRQNDFSRFFQILQTAHQRPELRVDPVSFQRPADGGTILMAAAMHGRVDVIETVLRSSSASVLQQDWEGATAAVFAKRHNHPTVETALLACEEAEREKEYVYDVYCVDVSASNGRDGSSGVPSDEVVANAPIVSVSAAVQRWLTQDANAQPLEEDEVEEYMLESDVESNADDRESVDSNDEDYIYNDYPDEESSDSSFDSDSDEDTGPRRFTRNHKDDDQVYNDSSDY